MREKFYFFWTFRDTAQAIEDPKARLEYLEAVIKHGLGEEEWELSPLINALMVQTRFTLDRSQEISDSASERWKKWWAPKWNQNAKKNWEIISKQPNSSKNKQEQTKTSEEEVEEEVEVEEEYIKKKINKKKFLDFVLLSDDEYNKLISTLGEKLTTELIDKLNNYIWSTWKRYKSHYFTILQWSKKESTTTTPEREDDVDNAIQHISNKNLKAKMQFEIWQRRKNWMSVNMQIYENILNRLLQQPW